MLVGMSPSSKKALQRVVVQQWDLPAFLLMNERLRREGFPSRASEGTLVTFLKDGPPDAKLAQLAYASLVAASDEEIQTLEQNMEHVAKMASALLHGSKADLTWRAAGSTSKNSDRKIEAGNLVSAFNAGRVVHAYFLIVDHVEQVTDLSAFERGCSVAKEVWEQACFLASHRWAHRHGSHHPKGFCWVLTMRGVVG